MEEAKASVMIANSPHSLYSRGAMHYVIGQDGKGSYVMEKMKQRKKLSKG